MITIPITKPEATAALDKFWSPSERIHFIIVKITWKIAPAPIARKITEVKGEYTNPPTHAPKIAGAPAIIPRPASLPIINFPRDMGAAIAIPSVVLCKANPTIKKVLKATEPNPTAAPIANPSPKLCKPMPIDIIRAIATGFAIFVLWELFTNFSLV